MLIAASDCADLLGVSISDALLTRLVSSTDAWIKREISREFERKVRTEVVTAFCTSYVVLRESPIRTLTEVRIDTSGVFGSSSIQDVTQFAFTSDPSRDDPRVYWTQGYAFPTGSRVAQVTYEAGWWPPASGGVTTLTSSGTTATATTDAAHGLTTGQSVVISGATPVAYNGTYTITVTSTTQFTYTFAGGTSPATGSILWSAVSDMPSDLQDRLIERVAARYKQGADEEMQSEAQGDRRWQKFMETDARILADLSRYRRSILY